MAIKLLLGLCFALTVLVVSLEGIRLPRRPIEKQGLTIIQASKTKVSGSYHGSTAHIHFSSEANDHGSSISVTSSTGAPIFIMVQPQDSSVLTMSMGDQKFVSKMNKPNSGFPRYSDYVVPQVFHRLVQFASMQQLTSALIPLFESLSHAHDVNATRRRQMENLVADGQADAIVEAAKALGDAGVMGYDNPAALQFYALAMRLEGAKEMLQAQAAEAYAQNLLRSLTSRAKRMAPSGVRGYISWPRKVHAESSDCTCTTGSPPCMGDQNNECNGMCGRKCSCWSYVCGDCCVHEGCRIHDNCCARDGYLSTACLNLFNFSCTSYTC